MSLNSLCFFIAFCIFLQSEMTAQIIGLKGGLSLSQIHSQINEIPQIGLEASEETSDFLVHHHFGLSLEFPIKKVISIETGVLLSIKGGKMKVLDSNPPVWVDKKVFIAYYNLPLNLKGTFPISDEISLLASAGIYFDLAIFGLDKIEDRNPSILNLGVDDAFGRFDFGFASGLGVLYNSISIGLSHEFSLVNISGVKEFGDRRIRLWKLSLAYQFNRD